MKDNFAIENGVVQKEKHLFEYNELVLYPLANLRNELVFVIRFFKKYESSTGLVTFSQSSDDNDFYSETRSSIYPFSGNEHLLQKGNT